MSELSPRTQALLDAARAAGGPTPEDRARVFAAVAARAGIAGAAASAVSVAPSSAAAATVTATAAGAAGKSASVAVAGTKLVAVVALVSVFGAAAGVAAALRWLPRAPVAGQRHTVVAGASRARTAPLPPPVANPASEPAAREPAPSVPARVAPALERVAEPAVVRAEPPAARPRPVARATRAQPTGAAGAHAAPAPIEDASSALGDELTLLRGARAALRARDHATALALLEQHAARFPAGMLREERDANRAIALCRLGRRAEAERAATRFFVTYAHSPYAERVRSACTVERP